MENLFLSNEGLKFIIDFNANLKDRTKKCAGEREGAEFKKYVPWHSLRVALEDGESPRQLYDFDYEKGELLTDPYHLHQISLLLSGVGKKINESLPVAPEDWPVMVDIKAKRQDAISAFREGRVLLSSSPQLDVQYDELIEYVVPLNREKPSGYDSELARGIIFRSFPKGRTGLLAGFQLAHGLGHQIGMNFFASDPIFSTDPDSEIFYEVRHDVRSARHAFVSAVALGYMVILSRAIYGSGSRPVIADDHVAGYSPYLPDALSAALRSLQSSCGFTEFGQVVLNSLEELCRD